MGVFLFLPEFDTVYYYYHPHPPGMNGRCHYVDVKTLVTCVFVGRIWRFTKLRKWGKVLYISMFRNDPNVGLSLRYVTVRPKITYLEAPLKLKNHFLLIYWGINKSAFVPHVPSSRSRTWSASHLWSATINAPEGTARNIRFRTVSIRNRRRGAIKANDANGRITPAKEYRRRAVEQTRILIDATHTASAIALLRQDQTDFFLRPTTPAPPATNIYQTTSINTKLD